MARGWESKAVEAQQDAAATRPHLGAPVSTEESSRRAHLATLQLARVRAEADLRTATAPAHRSMLERAIADLSQQIDSLSK